MSLIIHYPLQENDSNVYYQGLSSSGTGQRNSSLTSVSGPGGVLLNAYQGTDNTDYITHGLYPAISSGQNISFTAWVKDAYLDSRQCIIAKGINNQVGFFFDLGGGIGNIYLRTLVGGEVVLRADHTGWHHYAGVISGTHGSIYIDGNLSKTGTVSGVPNNLNVQWRVGQFGTITAGYYAISPMADIRVYDHPLTPVEVSGIYNSVTGDIQLVTTSVTQRLGNSTIRVGRGATTNNIFNNTFNPNTVRRYINRFDEVLYYQYTGV